MYDIFASLCREKGVTPYEVSKAIGAAQSTFSDWKRGSQPRPKRIKAIADYFGVSVDYLMTGKEKDIAGQEDEKALDPALVAMLQALPADKIQRVKDFVSGMLAT